MRYTKHLAVVSLLLFGAAACDLHVTNPNAPDATRAISNPDDVQALISGSWSNWWFASHNFAGSSPLLSTASFQHGTWCACFGMTHHSAIPRVPTTNDPAHAVYGNIAYAWTISYRAIAAVNDGLRALNAETPAGAAIRADMGAARVARARAFGAYVQGISYGNIALKYDRGPIVTPETDLGQPQEYVSYTEVMAHAVSLLEEAASIAEAAAAFQPIPTSWMWTDQETTGARLAQVARSYKARLRAAVSRTPEERQAVDWNAVLADVNAGIGLAGDDFAYEFHGDHRWFGSLYYSLLWRWSQMSHFVHGMADQSGRYQEWMGLPVYDRHPILPSGEFIIETPDLRFPQGATRQEQVDDGFARAGAIRFRIPGMGSDGSEWPQADAEVGAQWSQPGRGTWRWSYYRDARHWDVANIGIVPDVSTHEMRLLAAEAHYRLGNAGEAANLVNVTRTAAGLDATDAAGTNTSCVPRLPNGSCGDLFEMLKWEKRLEAGHNAGLLMAQWYFDGRGWGDLMQGTILNWPVPAQEAELVGEPIENFGGSLEWGAPVGTYGY